MSENAKRNRAEHNKAEQGTTDPTRIKHKYSRINLDYATRLDTWRPAVSGREAAGMQRTTLLASRPLDRICWG